MSNHLPRDSQFNLNREMNWRPTKVVDPNRTFLTIFRRPSGTVIKANRLGHTPNGEMKKAMRALVVAVLSLAVSLPALAKDHTSEYQVGIFSSTGQLSDGSYAVCNGRGCSAYSASHNIHYVRTTTGMYVIAAPISVAKTLGLGMLTGGNSPMVHNEWFMDQLHEGDKVLFAPQCRKNNDCMFYLPNPDKVGKEYVSLGYFRPDVAKSNTQTLCGTGKLTPQVEAQVCPVGPVGQVTNPAAPVNTSSAANTQPTPSVNPNQRGPATKEKW